MSSNPTPFQTLPPIQNSRLSKQIEFLLEADKLKNIERRTHVSDGSRHENSAEHSWHFALGLMLFAEHAKAENLDIFKIMQMAILHDLVEIDAGDTFVYDTKAQETRAAREQQAADRLFGLLPPDQEAAFRAIWDEFEAKETEEAKFAASIDRFAPVLENYVTSGKAWRAHGVAVNQVEKVVGTELENAPALGEYLKEILVSAKEKGFLK